MSNWIAVDEMLPCDKQQVLILTNRKNVFGYNNDPRVMHVAIFVKGRTKDQVAKDRTSGFGDEASNNLRPYAWSGDGPCNYFGQDVTHWMHLPQPPSTEEDFK